MELIGVFKILWRRRLLVVLVLAAAVAAMVAANARSSGTTTAGTAVSRVLVDTPRSMLTTARVIGSEVAGFRAAMFADEMSADSTRAAIARRAGISPDELVVRGATAQEPLTIGPLPVRAAIAALDQGAPYVVQVTPESRIPIVNLSAYAPDVPSAERLARAATATMGALNVVPDGERSGAVVTALGPPDSALIVQGGSKKLAIAAVVFVLGGGLIGIVLLDALLRWWRGLERRPREPRVPVVGVRASAAFAADVAAADVRRVRRALTPWRRGRPPA